MRRILFVAPAVSTDSGWGRYAANLMNAARGCGYQAASIAVAGTRPLQLFRAVVHTLSVSRGAEIIYAVDGWPYGAIAWVVAFLTRKKLIVGAVGTYTIAPFYNRYTKWVIRKVYESADVVIAISRYTADRLRKFCPEIRVTIVHPSIDVDAWLVPRNPMAPPMILSVGAVKSRKGYLTALEAFTRVRKSIPGLQWCIIGSLADVGYVSKVRAQAQVLGVADAIEWAGVVSDANLKKYYSRASLFLLLSENEHNHFEGFGIVFLEAAAAGLPVVGTSDNGIEDAIGPNNGVLVGQKSPEAAATAMRRLLQDSEASQLMSGAGPEWARNFDTPVVSMRLKSILSKLQ